MNFSSIIQEIMPFLQIYGLLVIFLGIFLEGEITIIIAGILIQKGVISLEETLLTAIIAAYLSDQAWFQLGRHYGQCLLNKFPLLLKHQNKIQPWIQSKSDYIALGGRFIYGTRIIGYLLLGIHRYSTKRFMLIDSFVTIVWCFLGIALGFFLGTSADAFLGTIKEVEKLLLLIAVIGISWHGYKNRKKNSQPDQQEK